MPLLRIPPDRISAVQSRECEAWVVENCPHAVQGRALEDGTFALEFADQRETEAFRVRWLG